MEVGKQEVAGPQEFVLLRQRLFYLDNKVGLQEGGGVVNERGSGVNILFVGEAAALACASFDQYTVTLAGEQLNAAGRGGDTELLVFDLARNANNHSSHLLPCKPDSPVRGRRHFAGQALGKPTTMLPWPLKGSYYVLPICHRFLPYSPRRGGAGCTGSI